MPRAKKSGSIAVHDIRVARFIALIATGEHSAAVCYERAGFNGKKRSTFSTEACTLLKNPKVKEILTGIRDGILKDAGLKFEQKRRFLRDIVLTPVGMIDEMSILAQKVTRTRTVTEKGGTEKEVVEMPDKLRAIELDSKLAGELTGGTIADDTTGPVSALAQPDVDSRVGRILGEMLRVTTRPRQSTGPVQEAVVVPTQQARKLENLALGMARDSLNGHGKKTNGAHKAGVV